MLLKRKDIDATQGPILKNFITKAKIKSNKKVVIIATKIYLKNSIVKSKSCAVACLSPTQPTKQMPKARYKTDKSMENIFRPCRDFLYSRKI